jgi:CRP-like cAMP-binding protein
MSVSRSQLHPSFVKLFKEIVELTDDEFEMMLGHFNAFSIKKKEHYLKAGEVWWQVAAVNKGCFRTYSGDSDGKEHILYFAMEGWWIGDIESFHTGKPTNLYVQALEDCELLLMPKSSYDKLVVELPKYRDWYDQKVLKAYAAAIKRYSDFKSGSAEDRYNNLLSRQPQVLQRVPSKFIAAYLEIEPESLSRLRKKMYEK